MRENVTQPPVALSLVPSSPPPLSEVHAHASAPWLTPNSTTLLLNKNKKNRDEPPRTSSLTSAVAVHILVADAADAVAQRHQPGSVGAAVELGRFPLLRVLHAGAPHLHQRGRVHVRHRVGEGRQVPQGGRAALVEHLAAGRERERER